jgi:hypothetical protein
MPRIIKRDPSRSQFNWLNKVQGVAPSGLQYHYSDEFSYDMAIGQHPTPTQLYDGLNMHVWPMGELLLFDRYAYITYCQTKGPLPSWVIREIETAELTPVGNCHGDATCKNAIWDVHQDRLVLFDPGNARGLPCREIDEAKILQSMDGFDEYWLDHPPIPYQRPFKIRRIHLALLYTHYLRILAHDDLQQPHVAHEFARSRMEELNL